MLFPVPESAAGITAQVIVVVLYALFLALFFTYDSNLKIDLMAGNYAYPIVYFLFILVSLSLYFAVGFKDPGYMKANASEIGMMLSDQDTVGTDGVQLDEVDDDMDAEDRAGGRDLYCRVCHLEQVWNGCVFWLSRLIVRRACVPSTVASASAVSDGSVRVYCVFRICALLHKVVHPSSPFITFCVVLCRPSLFPYQ